MQVESDKYNQEITNIKRSLLRISFGTSRQKNCPKFLIPPPPPPVMYNLFPYQTHPETKSAHDVKSFCHFFVIPSSIVYQKFLARQMINARKVQKHPERFIDEKIDQKCDTTLCKKFFDTRSIKGSSYFNFRYCENKIPYCGFSTNFR